MEPNLEKQQNNPKNLYFRKQRVNKLVKTDAIM